MIDKAMVKTDSKYLQNGGILTFGIADRYFPTEVGKKAAFGTYVVSFNEKRKNGARTAYSHSFDTAMRPEFRGAFTTDDKYKEKAIVHATPEAASRYLQPYGSRLHPADSAYCSLDMIAHLLGKEIAFGDRFASGEGGKEFLLGGVDSLTDVNYLLSMAVLKNRDFGRDDIRYIAGEKEIVLTKKAADEFSDKMTRWYTKQRLSGKDLQSYAIAFSGLVRDVSARIQDGNFSGAKGVPPEEREEISDYITETFGGLAKIMSSNGMLSRPSDLKRGISAESERAIHLVRQKYGETPISLHGSLEVKHTAVLEAILYQDYVRRQLVEPLIRFFEYLVTLEPVQAEAILNKGDCGHSVKVKLSDGADNCSDILLSNWPTQTRKGGILISEMAYLLDGLGGLEQRALGPVARHIHQLRTDIFSGLFLQAGRLAGELKIWYEVTKRREEGDTMHEGLPEKLKQAYEAASGWMDDVRSRDPSGGSLGRELAARWPYPAS